VGVTDHTALWKLVTASDVEVDSLVVGGTLAVEVTVPAFEPTQLPGAPPVAVIHDARAILLRWRIHVITLHTCENCGSAEERAKQGCDDHL
jgi:hypothetical protein